MLLKNWYEFPIIKDVYDQDVCPRTENQLKLIQTIDENDIIFVSGPAGSGKTMVSIAKAIQYYEDKRKGIHKIVISRPVVDSGESLGFLPGSLEEKIHPYLLPLYEYLQMFLKKPQSGRKERKSARKGNQKSNQNKDVPDYVEIAPFAYLRGRTFHNSFILIDESQNLSKVQMKLLLTRIGKGSKIVLTGDERQSDLSSKIEQGFTDAIERLVVKKSIPKIAHVKMGKEDVLRNDIIRHILDAYEE